MRIRLALSLLVAVLLSGPASACRMGDLLPLMLGLLCAISGPTSLVACIAGTALLQAQKRSAGLPAYLVSILAGTVGGAGSAMLTSGDLTSLLGGVVVGAFATTVVSLILFSAPWDRPPVDPLEEHPERRSEWRLVGRS